MKRTLILFATALICAVSCGTAGEFSVSDRFQDGIYYKPDPTKSGREPLTEEEFRYLAQMDNFRQDLEPADVVPDTVYVDFDAYPYYRIWRWGWHYYPNYWSGYHWGYYNYYGYSYWGYPYYYYGWYDPWYWDPWYYDPWYGPYGYYGYHHPYHHYYGSRYGSYYGWNNSGNYTHRSGSATSGRYSHPGVASRVGNSRLASAAAKRDLDHLKVQRSTHKTTAVNREPSYPETSNYRTTTATRASSSASYNSSSSRYESKSSSSRSSSSYSGGSSRSSGGYSGGGGHSSHSSGGGGGSHHSGGHR